MINEVSRVGNLFLVKHFLESQIPKDILVFASESGNAELVKFIFKQEGIDINAKNDFYFNNLKFQNNIWDFFKLFKTALIFASFNSHPEIVKILVEQEGIDINAKDNYVYFNNLGFQNNIWNFFKLFMTAHFINFI